jgi:hypothetical protein
MHINTKKALKSPAVIEGKRDTADSVRVHTKRMSDDETKAMEVAPPKWRQVYATKKAVRANQEQAKIDNNEAENKGN